jgi:hypothetical protein
MFNEFQHRQVDCTVEGIAEKVILSRLTRGRSIVDQEYVYNGVFSPTSTVALGAKVATTDTFLVQSLRKTPDGDHYCTMVKTNATITVQRYGQAYDANDNPIGGPSFSPVTSGVITFAEFVNASLRMKQEGLLLTTVYTLILQTNVDVKPPQDDSLESPDRILLAGKPYQVDNIDTIRFPNLLFIELSEDRR